MIQHTVSVTQCAATGSCSLQMQVQGSTPVRHRVDSILQCQAKHGTVALLDTSVSAVHALHNIAMLTHERFSLW